MRFHQLMNTATSLRCPSPRIPSAFSATTSQVWDEACARIALRICEARATHAVEAQRHLPPAILGNR